MTENIVGIAQAVAGTAMIYLYHYGSGELHMVGMGTVAPSPIADDVRAFRDFVARIP